MSDDKTYLELVLAAEASLRALLLRTEPGTGLALHQALGEIRQLREDEQRAADVDALRERQSEWRRLDLPARHRLVLVVLGDRRLTIREICVALNDLRDDWTVYLSHVQSTITRLHARGDLARVPDRASGRRVYRYFHPTTLTGPIADLDRAFHDADPET
jgi:hypothetical protein